MRTPTERNWGIAVAHDSGQYRSLQRRSSRNATAEVALARSLPPNSPAQRFACGHFALDSMFEPNVQRVLQLISADDVVLDIGGWASPFNRANYVMDAFPYETRGFYRTFGGPASQG